MGKNKKNSYIKPAYARLINWRDFFLGYLGASRICAQTYLQKNNVLGNDIYYRDFIFIPAFWNFKHAIELVLKFIAIEKEKAPQKIKNIIINKTHNILSLIDELIRQGKINQSQANELFEICEKYINFKSLEKLLEDKTLCASTLHDPINMFFKYPEGDEAHAGFENYLYVDLFTGGTNLKAKEKLMNKAIIELQNDSKRFSILCANIFNS